MSIIIQIVTLVLAGYYCWLVGSWRNTDRDNDRLVGRFVAPALVLGVAIVGLAAAKVLGATAFVVGIVVLVVVLVQAGLLRMAGALTLRRELTGEVLQIKKKHLALLAMLLGPPVMLYTGVNPVRDQILMYIVASEMIAISALFLTRTARLFMQQKVSLLVWFLYLCAVEIFPVGFILVLAAKNA